MKYLIMSASLLASLNLYSQKVETVQRGTNYCELNVINCKDSLTLATHSETQKVLRFLNNCKGFRHYCATGLYIFPKSQYKVTITKYRSKQKLVFLPGYTPVVWANNFDVINVKYGN